MGAGQWHVALVAMAALGTMALLVRPVLLRGEPWWVAWPAPAGALALVVALLTGLPLWLTVGGGAVLVAGMAAQLVWSYRKGRYLEDDVATLWRFARRTPAEPRRRHRARDD